MLAVLSPAKKLAPLPDRPAGVFSRPEFATHSASLMARMAALGAGDLGRLMKISPQLAALNFERNQRLVESPPVEAGLPAVFAFRGDTYRGLDADSLDEAGLEFARDHLRILSGLYGLLRPGDLIQPYRLEMGTRLNNPAGEDLYDFWTPAVAPALNRALAGAGSRAVINLASKEYFRAVDVKALEAPVITPVFKDMSKGRYRVLGLFAKQARGMMARFMIDARLDDIDGLKDFHSAGYRYSPADSTPESPVFLRQRPAP